MAGLLEPELLNVTLSPCENITGLTPASQLAVPTTSQLLLVPSPRQTRLADALNGDTTTLTASVKPTGEPLAAKIKLASPVKPGVGVNCAVWPSPSNATVPLVALET